MAALGLLSNQKQNPNPNGAGATTANPYAGGFSTTDTGTVSSNAGGLAHSGQVQKADGSWTYDTSGSSDPDAQALQSLTNEDAAARRGQNDGVSFANNAAQENVYSGRLAEKNALSEQINAAPGLLNAAQDNNRLAAGQAVGQGLKNTNNNYNSRGLLYSGSRVGADQSIQNQGAANYQSAAAGTAADSANATAAAKNAYASVDLQSQQASLTLANNAFDTANANNIARLQAMQQLGQGVGSVAGSVAGNLAPGPTTPYQNPLTGQTQLQPTGWQAPEQIQDSGYQNA